MRPTGLPVVALAVILAGCSSPRTTERLKDDALQAVHSGDFAAAATAVDKVYKCTDGDVNDKHGLLWAMERGIIAGLAGDADLSWRMFNLASAKAKQHRTVDRRRAAASWVANDTVKDYSGAAYEHAWIEIQRVLTGLQKAQFAAGVQQGSAEPAIAAGVPAPGPATMTIAVDAEAARQHYEHAINVARGLTNDVLTWTKDIAGTERYRDDPFARLLAAITALAQPQPMDLDRQYAVVQAEKAVQAYAQERRSLAGKEIFRYEVAMQPKLAEAVFLRSLAAYDPERLLAVLADRGLTRAQAVGRGLLPPVGSGAVVIVHQNGWAARRHILDIRIAAGHASYRVTPAPGYPVERRRIGGLVWWVKGPDVTVADTLFGIPVPAGLGKLLAPGGLAWMGFSVPVHAPDRTPLLTPPRVQIVAAGGARPQVATTVVADVDAQARATLKDRQGGIIGKTLARATAKQVATAVAAREARKQDKGLGLLVNIIGSFTSTITEIADTRCWTMLPGTVEAALVDLSPGDHALYLVGADGARVPLGTVAMKPGRLVVVSTRSLTPPQLLPR